MPHTNYKQMIEIEDEKTQEISLSGKKVEVKIDGKTWSATID